MPQGRDVRVKGAQVKPEAHTLPCCGFWMSLVTLEGGGFVPFKGGGAAEIQIAHPLHK